MNDEAASKGGSEIQAATKQLDATILERADAYVVIVSPYGTPRRRPYLNLHHAATAVARARGKGQDAWLVMCRLVPMGTAEFNGGELS